MATTFGLAVLLVILGILAMVVLPGAGFVVGVIVIVVAIVLIANGFRRGRQAL